MTQKWFEIIKNWNENPQNISGNIQKNGAKCPNFSVWRLIFGGCKSEIWEKAATKKNVRTKIKNIRTLYRLRRDEIFFHPYELVTKKADIWTIKKSRTAIPGLSSNF